MALDQPTWADADAEAPDPDALAMAWARAEAEPPPEAMADALAWAEADWCRSRDPAVGGQWAGNSNFGEVVEGTLDGGERHVEGDL